VKKKPPRATGAGDTFASTLTRACRGAMTPVAANLASTAAAVVVGKDGTTVCSIRELREMLLTPSLSAADKYLPNSSWLVARGIPASGRRIVFYEWVF